MSKAKARPIELGRPKQPSREQIIDEFGELDRQIKQMAPAMARYEVLKAQIKAWYNDHPADQGAIAVGERYEIQVSAREKERRIRDMATVFKAVGLKRFMAICSVALGKLEEAIGKAKTAGLVDEGFTGSRRLKAVARAPEYQEAA